MEIKKIRVMRLNDFVKQNDGAAELERKFPEINASYISQLINYHRPFGEKSARNFEKIFGLETNYFDSLDIDYNKSSKLKHLNNVAQNLPSWAIDEVINDALKKAELIKRVQAENTPPNK